MFPFKNITILRRNVTELCEVEILREKKPQQHRDFSQEKKQAERKKKRLHSPGPSFASA